MDNQQFYNPNSHNQAPRFRSLQFPEPKPASAVKKSLSLGTKPPQTPGGSKACEERHAQKTASSAEDARLHDSVHVETPDFPATEGYHAEDDCSGIHSPVGNASDNDSDSELRSLFSELGDDSSDTESNLDFKLEGTHKPSEDGIAGETGRLRTGESKDTPIVLDDECFANSTDEGEEERREGDEINTCTAACSPSGKRKRESESEISSLSTKEPRLIADFSGRDETQSSSHHSEELVWEYRRLRGYKVENGEKLVFVAWSPTWEPTAEFPIEEVEKIRRRVRRIPK